MVDPCHIVEKLTKIMGISEKGRGAKCVPYVDNASLGARRATHKQQRSSLRGNLTYSIPSQRLFAFFVFTTSWTGIVANHKVK